MVPYLLTLLSVAIAALFHWISPKAFWRATLMSSCVILLLSIGALFIFEASGFLVSENTGRYADLSGRLPFITLWVSVFALLISFFVGWFFNVIRK